MKLRSFFFAVVVMFLAVTTHCQASGAYEVKHKNAIVLAMFGTTVEPALQGLAKYPLKNYQPNIRTRQYG